MIHKIFSVYDTKAKAYLAPFFMHQEGMAARVFTNMVNDPNKSHQFSMNPEDYTLFVVGQWDDETCIFETRVPETLGNGLEYIDGKISNDPPVLTGTEG